MQVSVTEAKNKLTQLLAAVELGEEVLIARHGSVIARIVPPARKQPPRFGFLRLQDLVLDPDWSKPQNDLESWFRGDV